MAPYKLEENFKEKLEKRSLNPTDQAWEKLADKLDSQESKSKYNLYAWLSIAAMILVLLSVGIHNYNNGNGKSDLPILVNVDNENSKSKTELNELNTNKLNEIQLTEVQETKNEAIITSKEEITPVNNDMELKNNYRKESKAVAHRNELVKNGSIATDSKKITKPQTIELDLEVARINEVVADIQKLQIENTSVSDREIDSLLKAAHRELLTDKINDSKTITVDADALLLEIEQDIESSFRSKVFEALKDSYNTIKTSVAERNN